MAAKEIDVVKRLLLDLTKEITEKGLVAQGWPETMEIVFDKKARDSLEKSLMDAKEGRVSFLTWLLALRVRPRGEGEAMTDPPWIEKLPIWWVIYAMRLERVFKSYTPHKIAVSTTTEMRP